MNIAKPVIILKILQKRSNQTPNLPSKVYLFGVISHFFVKTLRSLKHMGHGASSRVLNVQNMTKIDHLLEIRLISKGSIVSCWKALLNNIKTNHIKTISSLHFQLLVDCPIIIVCLLIFLLPFFLTPSPWQKSHPKVCQETLLINKVCHQFSICTHTCLVRRYASEVEEMRFFT